MLIRHFAEDFEVYLPVKWAAFLNAFTNLYQLLVFLLCKLLPFVLLFVNVLLPHIGFVLISLVVLDFGLSVFVSLVAHFFNQYRVMIVLADGLTKFALVNYFKLAKAVRYLYPALCIWIVSELAELGTVLTDSTLCIYYAEPICFLHFCEDSLVVL